MQLPFSPVFDAFPRVHRLKKDELSLRAESYLRLKQLSQVIEQVSPDIERQWLQMANEVFERLVFYHDSNKNQEWEKKLLEDLFRLIDSLGHFPCLPLLRDFLLQETSFERLKTVFKLFDRLSYNETYRSFLPILELLELKSFDSLKVSHLKTQLPFSQSIRFDLESTDDVVGAYLDYLLAEKNQESGFEFCEHLLRIESEPGFFRKMKRIIDFLDWLYGDPVLKKIEKAYVHFVRLDSELQALNLYHYKTKNDLFDWAKVILDDFPQVELMDAFSKGQVESKMWAANIITELFGEKNGPRTALITCSWIGLLGYLMSHKTAIKQFIMIDKDPLCEKVNKLLNVRAYNGCHVNSTTVDIYQLNPTHYDLPHSPINPKHRINHFDIVINTSCEHLERFTEWFEKIPQGQLVLLQSNDFFDCDKHINCVSNLAEFEQMAPMSQVLFKGELQLEKYRRFMLIGYK